MEEHIEDETNQHDIPISVTIPELKELIKDMHTINVRIGRLSSDLSRTERSIKNFTATQSALNKTIIPISTALNCSQ